MRRPLRVAAPSLVAVVLAGASLVVPAATVPAIAASPAYAHAGYAPHEVAAGDYPYADYPLQPKEPTGLVDATGVRMFASAVWTAGKPVDHPVAQAQYGLQLLNSYRLTHDAWYLDRAERQGQRLVDTHVEVGRAWWFPYQFDFAMTSGQPRPVLTAPWYSGMAQGVALSLLVRLGEATGDPTWQQAADAVFASFGAPVSATQPWAVRVDGAGYLWLEEYPRTPATMSEQVLNGHLYAIYGVWDYWRVTRSAQAAALFDGAATMVAHYVPSAFRRPGAASVYSLLRKTPHESYHAVHVNQLHHLAALAAAPVFANLGDTLLQDFPAPRLSGTVRFSAGSHAGRTFKTATGGAVVSTKTITLTRASNAPFDQRRRLTGQSGYWYHVTKGALAGRWVQESFGRRAATDAIAAVPYFGRRVLHLAPKTYSAYNAKGSRTATFTRATSAPVTRVGWFNGRLSVLVSAGVYQGYWMPITSGATLT
jgi:hypothetical protein